MSETWIILEKQVTGQTQYVTASWLDDAGNEAILGATQPSPIGLVAGAISSPFNIEGYGSGITMSYQVVAGVNVQMALDTNNDMTGIIRNKNLIGSITTNTTVSNAVTATVVPTSQTGTGSGASFSLTSTTSGGITTFTSIEIITNSGSGYKPGDTFTWTPATLNGSGFGVVANNLVLTLQEDNLYIADNSWVETLTPATVGTGTFFMTSKEAHGAARLRIKSANVGNLLVSNFRLICNS